MSDGTAIMRGIQVCNFLKTKGYDCDVLENNDERLLIEKHSIIVFIKHVNFNIIERLKENNNILIHDVLDQGSISNAYYYGKPYKKYGNSLLDMLIVNNNEYENTKIKDLPKTIIHHHWDSRIAENINRDFLSLCYLGDPKNIRNNLDYSKIEKLKCIFSFRFDRIRYREHNCHLSIWKENTQRYNYGPCTKVSTASATMSNIILTRNPSHLEILDSSYPYYTDSNIDSVLKTIEKAKLDYGTKRWKEGINMIREVKERTALENISKVYIKLFESL
jgi:hypothetical protein